jgi:hypothetical protein
MKSEKKFILLTPEEWVRQHVIRFLIDEKNILNLILTLKKIVKINGMHKRYDLVVFT